MVAPDITEEEENQVAKQARQLSKGKRTLAQDLIPGESPSSSDLPKHVVVVMDALKEFTMEPLEWVLKNIALEASCSVTLLGVTPWLNIPLSSKTWSDVWTMDLEDLLSIPEKTEWKSDSKYQKVQKLIDLCQQYGDVFDNRHHQRYSEYYAQRIPCNMVMMNEDGEVDMIKGRSLIDNVDPNTPEESPVSSAPTPTLIIAEHLKRIFKQRA
ncbi:hypothetical protein CsSME_00044525 [Camellia sinensis var. sinensis]